MSWFSRGLQQSMPSGASAALLEDMTDLDSAGLGIAAIRARVIERFVAYANAEHGVLFDRRAPTGRHHITFSSLARERETGRQLQPGDKLCRWLTANELCLHVQDDRAVTSYLPDEDRALFQLLSARLIVPLLAGGRLPGLVFLTSSQPQWPVPQSARATLCAAGRIAGTAIERAHAKDIEQERLGAQHRAQQLTVAGRLAAEVAHEIRNPLAAIRLTIQGILDKQFDLGTSTRMLEHTLDEVDRIQETVARLLNLGRPEQLSLEEVNLSEIAAVAVDLVRSLASRSSIRVEVDLRQPLLVRADRVEMQKVFLNLLMNACQAMVGGGVLRVSSGITTGRPSERQSFGCISVADSGSGVAPDWLDKAFVPFFTTKKTGTGLGLPISLDIVTRHGGRLELANSHPAGTVATVALPLKDEREADA